MIKVKDIENYEKIERAYDVLGNIQDWLLDGANRDENRVADLVEDSVDCGLALAKVTSEDEDYDNTKIALHALKQVEYILDMLLSGQIDDVTARWLVVNQKEIIGSAIGD